ncbi:Calcium/proton exchanger [Thelephora terrestris]|uniref:Calcium/proton exchanger n=1 Tax=Thelephora terrestris TaxID=56493 RepID=A0A9P6HMK0_9AGAM|nr:Calcium/proton exchanger [Thelephora terrestris]
MSGTECQHGGIIVESPVPIRDTHLSIDDPRGESEEGRHSTSHTVRPSRAATYPPITISPAPSVPIRSRKFGGQLSERTDGTPVVDRLTRAMSIPVGRPPSIRRQLRSILLASLMINMLLLAIPISWALHFAVPGQYTLVFLFSLIAIIPLAKLLAFATKELSMRVGETLAGLINTTLGSAVELIVAIIALVKCELRVVQSSLVGSILRNLLLVLGFCFFVGGTKFSEQGFPIRAAHVNSSLLNLSVFGVLIPAGLDVVAGNRQISGFDAETEQRNILKLSHGLAVVLLIMYLSYIYFQLFSHKNLYHDEALPRPETIRYAAPDGPSWIELAKARARKALNIAPGRTDTEQQKPEETEEGEAEPELSLSMAIGLLVVVTTLVAVTTESLVDSIDGLASSGKISEEFIGLILLPFVRLVGNPTEHVTAVTVSMKDKLSLSLGVAVGSSLQTALFVIPFTIILGWIIGRPITMLFDPFESIVLFLAVLTVNYVVQNGKSNWLKGIIMICFYVIVALLSWFYPGTKPPGLLTCSV